MHDMHFHTNTILSRTIQGFVLCTLFVFTFYLCVPCYVFAKEYIATWGNNLSYSTREEAIQGILLQAVLDESALLLTVRKQSTRYMALQSVLSEGARYLHYIQRYSESAPSPDIQKAIMERNPDSDCVAMDVFVNLNALAQFFRSFGVVAVHHLQPTITLYVDPNTKEKEYIEKTLRQYALIANIREVPNAPIRITVWKKDDAYFHATIKTKDNQTNALQALTLEQLWINLWKDTASSQMTSTVQQQSSVRYTLIVDNIDALDTVQALDAILTQGIQKNVGSVQLLDFSTQENTSTNVFSARWECTMLNEAQYLNELRKILAIYPDLQYRLIVHK